MFGICLGIVMFENVVVVVVIGIQEIIYVFYDFEYGYIDFFEYGKFFVGIDQG